jgi:very-short-patch-repair endonuclease
LRRAEGAAEDCEAACYDCLLSYSNQRDHNLLVRHSIRELLLDLKSSTVIYSPSQDTFAVHLEKLKEKCDSNLEKDWLDFLVANGLNLPTSAQKYFERAQTRPDFQFEQHKLMIYVDGPIHDFPDRQNRDAEKTALLDDLDYTVIRFNHKDDWLARTASFPHVFGVGKPLVTMADSNAESSETSASLDLDLFPAEWQSVVQRLSELTGLNIEPGSDVQSEGRVIGAYVMSIDKGDRELFVLDGTVVHVDTVTGEKRLTSCISEKRD